MTTYFDLAAKANSVHNKSVSSVLFECLAKLWAKWDASVVAKLRPKEDGLIDQINTLLYQRQYDSYGADIKLKRAKAMRVLANVPWNQLVMAALSTQLNAEIEREPADAVKEELRNVKAALS